MKPSNNWDSRDNRRQVRQAPRLRYRVRLRSERSEPVIFWMTNDAGYAEELAVTLTAIYGELVAWVEHWTPAGSSARWQPVVCEDRRQRGGRNGQPAPRRFVSGQTVQAELLAERTQRGGRKARIVGTDLVGPITNSDAVPSEVPAGTVVELRIGAIDRQATHVQLHWPVG